MDRDIEIETYPLFGDDDLSRRHGICDHCEGLTDHPDDRVCRACEERADRHGNTAPA